MNRVPHTEFLYTKAIALCLPKQQDTWLIGFLFGIENKQKKNTFLLNFGWICSGIHLKKTKQILLTTLTFSKIFLTNDALILLRYLSVVCFLQVENFIKHKKRLELESVKMKSILLWNNTPTGSYFLNLIRISNYHQKYDLTKWAMRVGR